MNEIIIPSDRSLTVSNECRKKNLPGRYLYVGQCQWCKYDSFLSFDIKCLPHDMELCQAELVLYTVNDLCRERFCNIYVCPLKDRFNSHTNYENQPECYCNMRIGSPDVNKKTVTFNITEFVSAWFTGRCSNYGLKLSFDCINKITPLLSFYSADCLNHKLKPYLKISYRECTDEEDGNNQDTCKHKSHKCPSPYEAVGCLLESIALEEKMIANILNAEGEKIRKVISMPECTIEDILDTNESVNNTLKNVFKVEAILQYKLENAENLMKQPLNQNCD